MSKAAETKLPYGPEVQSCISKLCPDVASLLSGNASITYEGVKYSFKDAQKDLLKKMVFMKTQPLSPNIDDESITEADINAVISELKSLPKCRKLNVVRMNKIIKYPHVRFIPARINSRGEYCAAHFKINTSNLNPRRKFCINTGFVISNLVDEVLFETKNKEFVEVRQNNKPVMTKQRHVVIPLIVSSEGFIHQKLKAIDPEDTGFFCATGYCKTGKLGKLTVYLLTFNTDNIGGTSAFRVIGSKFTLFKNRDTRDTRLVKNLRLPCQYEKGVVDTKAQTVTFPAFDKNAIESPVRVTDATKSLIVETDKIIFFCSRKREWAMENLLTLSGIWNGTTGKFIPPKVATGSIYKTNTHCTVALSSKAHLVTIVEENPTDLERFRLLNGFNFDMKDYKILNSCRMMIMHRMKNFALSYRQAVQYCKLHPGVTDVEYIMRAMDYGIQLEKIKFGLTDKELYEQGGEPFSVKVARKMVYFLCSLYGFENKQLKEYEERKAAEKAAKTEAENSNNKTPTSTTQSECVLQQGSDGGVKRTLEPDSSENDTCKRLKTE